MSKRFKNSFFAASVLALALALAAAAPAFARSTEGPGALPLWGNESSGDVRRIVVISDIHLGVDDAFAENVRNKGKLIDFLGRIVASGVDELVIGGDFLDEWFVPISYPAHTDSAAFYRRVADNNASVLDAFKAAIAAGVKVAYVPGNHDLLLDEKTLAELIPGIHQARDVRGLGTYRTGVNSEIAIEHGHRYDAFCAPDKYSNKQFTGAYPSILPPGYFFTRIASTSVVEGKSAPKKVLPQIQAPAEQSGDQFDAYSYYRLLAWTMSTFPISAGFDEKAIHVGIDGFNRGFSLREVLPRVRPDGSIGAPLYADNHKRWDAVQAGNGVQARNAWAKAVPGALDHRYLDSQAVSQYFNMDPTVDVVVFGHSHVPLVNRFTAGYPKEKVYANSGTWIDVNKEGADRTFVVIESGKRGTAVRLMEYREDGTILGIEKK